MKVVVDAAIASLHSHDGSGLDEMAARVGSRLGEHPVDIAQALMDDSNAALGRRRLLRPFRKYVQWNPADDGIVRLELIAKRGTRTSISGSLRAIPIDADDRTAPVLACT